MKKAFKILGLVLMLLLFFLLGTFLGSLIINNSIWMSLLVTTIPGFIFGLLTGLAVPRLWALSGLASLGYVFPGVGGGYPTIGPLTISEKLIFLIFLPVVFAFLGGYVGKRLLPPTYA